MAQQKKRVLFSVRDQIFEAMKESILTNRYSPGEEMQLERLAEEFGVSITPIREVMIRLESAGLVTIVPNKGARVAGIREEDIRNTWEMRQILEPYAARLTAALELGTELEELQKMTARLQRNPDDIELYQRSDLRLHELLYAHLANSLLRETLQRVHQMSRRMRYFAESVRPMHDQVVPEVIREHTETLAALKEHDPEGAARAVARHVANSQRRTLLALNQEAGGQT